MNQSVPVVAMAAVVAIIALAAIFYNPVPDVNVSQTDLRRTIDVIGTFTTTAMPDEVTVYATVETQASSAKTAQEENAVKTEAVRRALSGYDIETSYFSVSPRYDYSGGSGRITGYTAAHSLKIKTGDTGKAGEIADAAVSAGANRIDSIAFGLTDNREAETTRAALAEAGTAARRKADAVAGSLGVSISRVVSASESSYAIPYYSYARSLEAVQSAASTQITPGDVEVTASVSVSYEIA